MTRPWYLREPKLLEEVREDVRAFNSTLHVVIEAGVVYVRGTFPVKAGGRVLDRYAIEIRFPDAYPDDLPVLRELDGRIPWTAESHNFALGACLFLPEKREAIFPVGSPFIEYLRVPVHNYFLGQAIVAAGGEWPHGTETHGLDAVVEFYKETFKTGDAGLLARFVMFFAKGEFKGHWKCPCESGRRIRDCHPALLTARDAVTPGMAQALLERIDQKRPPPPRE